MGHNSLQVCMDSSDWLQGTIHEDSTTMDSSSPLSGDMLTCSRPLIERRLRPQHDQALKCPRCDSTHTKFCYYNNYSLSQPRYFCKTCRRYWTKGGTLRNIPVGGGCRKNKKVSPNSNNKKPNDNINVNPSSSSLMNNHLGGGGMSSSSSSHLHHHNPTDLHLSFPDQMQFSHLNNLMLGSSSNPSFMDNRYNGPIDFMESKLEAIVGNSRNYDFMGNGADHLGMMGGLGNNMGAETSFHHQGICSPFGISSSSLEGNNNTGANFMDTCQRLMLPYDHQENHDHQDHHRNGMMDVKPNAKLLSLEWQDQGGCSDHHGKESFGYLNGLGSWTNVMNNYGPSTTNPLV